MKRLLFYLLRFVSFISRAFSHRLYNKLIVKANKLIGVEFNGLPEYIDYSAHIDASGGLSIGDGCVISVNVIILTHDWSFLCRYKAQKITPPNGHLFDKQAFNSVLVGDGTFIGAGAIVLPGSHIGKYCIIGAGAVVKGTIEDYAIVVGNPARKIGDTRDPKYKLLE